MKILPIVVIGCLLSLAQFAQAADKPKFVSRTFQDILSRVDGRDKASMAIMTVRLKDDDNGQVVAGGPRFSIEEVSDHFHGKEVIVTLSRGYLTGTVVYEQYRLQIDDAIAEELLHQKKLKENQEKQQQKLAAERKQWQEEQERKIGQDTGGTLKFGMSREEIEAIKGKPLSVEIGPNPLIQDGRQRFNYFTLTYPDMELKFNERLIDVKLTRELPTSPSPSPSASTPSAPAAPPSSPST